ncbi:MAG: glycosyltransferase [Saprospiraceae bacterium]|nr:glycosyltransferase [Saprospiraceae bacterium]
MTKFEVTIPVLNEEETLKENVSIALNYIKNEITSNCSIIIADNGSTDRTEEIAAQLTAKNPEIKYIKLSKKGVGLALRTSWLQSNAEIVGYMDLDLATDLKHLREVFDLMQEGKTDMINGSRLLTGSVVKNRTLVREITSRIFNRLVQILLGVRLSDGMCGFKFFKNDIIKKIINTGIDTDNWFFSTEVLVKGLWMGLELKEIPVQWTDDSNSKVNIPRLSLQYIREIFRLRKEKRAFLINK